MTAQQAAEQIFVFAQDSFGQREDVTWDIRINPPEESYACVQLRARARKGGWGIYTVHALALRQEEPEYLTLRFSEGVGRVGDYL